LVNPPAAAPNGANGKADANSLVCMIRSLAQANRSLDIAVDPGPEHPGITGPENGDRDPGAGTSTYSIGGDQPP